MALSPLAHANIVETELEKVVDKVPTLFEREDTFYSTIEKKNVEVVSAKTMRVPLEIRPGGNFTAFDPDGGDMGKGSAPLFKEAKVDTYPLKLGIEWTKKSEWATDSSRKAVVNGLRHLLATAMAEFRRQCDSICLTAGDGALARISAETGTPDTYTCNVSGNGFGVRLLRVGQAVAVVSSNYSTNRTAGTDVNITAVDYQNKKVTIDAEPSGATANDWIVLGGLGNNTGSALASVQGVPYHHNNASSGNWLQLDRATYPEVVANGVNASSSAFALPFARRALNMIGDRLGQDKMAKVVAWMHPCQKQSYEELGQLVSVIQKQASQQALDLYFGDSMQMAGAPVKVHFSWDKTRIDFINSSLWGRAEMKPAGFYEVDGKRVFELRGTSTGTPLTKQIFYLVVVMNIYHQNPAGGAYIYGLTVPTGY